MHKADLKILIVEDDLSLGRAIEEGLRRSGYSTILATSGEQAINAAEVTDFYGLVIDCMLPKTNGLEVATKILKNSAIQMTTIFTSGIFKDRSYIHDVLLKTKAKAFLNKPFDLQDLINHFDESFGSLIGPSTEPLHQLLLREQYSYRDKLQAVNNTEFISGLELPLVYSMLLDNQISGSLKIQYDTNQPPTVIGFNRGRIDQVLFEDKESYFGVLLIEKGFTTPEELKKSLSEQESTPIGQFMVEHSYVSPHAIEIVQHEQMIIRLSKTIVASSVRISFQEEKKDDPEVFIDSFLLPSLLSDWINTKVNTEWLKSFYLPWLDHPILKGPDSSKINLLGNVSAGRALASFISRYEWPHTLQELISKSPHQEIELLKGVHFFLLQRVIVFGPKNVQVENVAAKMNRLQKIYDNFKSKNYFDVLGVTKNARPSEIQRAYHDLAKNFHPDKLPPNSPEELRKIYQNVFAIITDSFQTLSNEKKREHYLKTLELGEAEEVLAAESSFELGNKYLHSSQFREARKTFEKTMKMRGHRSDTVIFLIWALIKEKRHRSDRKALAAKVRDMLNQVAHEDRHSPPYFFIKGMYYEITGQIQKAYEHFKHCEIVDPYFTDARKEMTYIKQNYVKQRKPSLSEDIGTVVTKLFGKKSS